MKKDPQDRIKSLKNARAALDKKHSRHSNDDSPNYLTFKHPDNWFHIDYPAHWKVARDKDGAVQFAVSNDPASPGIMFFRCPAVIDADAILESGRWEFLAKAMFAKVNSTNVQEDPNIIYDNFMADRSEENVVGNRWFVICSDLMLGISSSCPPDRLETYQPLFERMLSSLRIYRDDELMATRVMARIQETVSEKFPDKKLKIDGLNLTIDRFELSISNLLAQIKRNPSGLNEAVDHFIQGTLGITEAAEPVGSESWESIRDRILPLLKSDKYIQDVNRRTVRGRENSFLISAPWLADVRICFALDNKDTFRFINSLDVQRWKVTLETLLEVASKNLVAFPSIEIHVMKLGEDLPGIGAVQPCGGAASSYLLHPDLYKIAKQKLGPDIVAAIPSRDALMLFEYRGEKRSLQDAVAKDFATTNHPISDRLFRVTPDGIALL